MEFFESKDNKWWDQSSSPVTHAQINQQVIQRNKFIVSHNYFFQNWIDSDILFISDLLNNENKCNNIFVKKL